MKIILQGPAHPERRDRVTAWMVEEGRTIAARDGASAGASFLANLRVDRNVIARVLANIVPSTARRCAPERRVDTIMAARIDDGIFLLKHHSWGAVMLHLLGAEVPAEVVDRALSGIQPRRRTT